MEGRVIKSTGSWYQVMDTEGNRYDARLRGKFKLNDKKITNPLSAGDMVEIEQEKGNNTWIIKDILPRKNYIIRKSPKKTEHGHIIAANIDQVVIIATIKKPRTSLGFIDRFLVTAESYRIPAVILFNKKDLMNPGNIDTVNEYRKHYDQMGYPLYMMSALDAPDIDFLKGLLKNKLNLFSGHSGVGKSTLINNLIPGISQKVSPVSDFANKGVHTTTFAEIFSLDGDSFIVDTPGIKELGLLEIGEEELAHFFPEMRQYLGQCKFNNCKHLTEPGCRVIQALEEGDIWENRYHNYLSMLEDADDHR